MKASLLVVDGKPQGMVIPFKTEQFTIGRDKGCNLRPTSNLVSNRHCAFNIHDGRLYLRDLGSTNGTLVNGEKITQTLELKAGDLVKVATLVFQVQLTLEAAPAPPSTVAAPAAVIQAAPSPAAALEATAVAHASPDDETLQWLMNEPNDPSDQLREPSADSTVLDIQATRAETATALPTMPAETSAAASVPGSSKRPAPPVSSKRSPAPAVIPDGPEVEPSVTTAPAAGEKKTAAPAAPGGDDSSSAADRLLKRYMDRRRT
ncbi:MAG: FHA domain-containing protein [Planctomycetia bacterium]